YNSPLERLTGGSGTVAQDDSQNFNSTLVRLTVAWADSDHMKDFLFQFHLGAINSLLSLQKHSQASQFQFHLGAINRTNQRLKELAAHLFQFHLGAINSLSDVYFCPRITTFHFHFGALTRGLVAAGRRAGGMSGIPRWCQ